MKVQRSGHDMASPLPFILSHGDGELCLAENSSVCLLEY